MSTPPNGDRSLTKRPIDVTLDRFVRDGVLRAKIGPSGAVPYRELRSIYNKWVNERFHEAQRLARVQNLAGFTEDYKQAFAHVHPETDAYPD